MKEEADVRTSKTSCGPKLCSLANNVSECGVFRHAVSNVGRLATVCCYSSFSGSRPKPFSPAFFFSQYLRTQASQLLPAAVSRPLKASAAMSE